MVYSVGMHKDNIRVIKDPAKMTSRQVKKILQIDEDHLKEKNNWYVIDNVFSYFRARKDCRLLTELLTKEFYQTFSRPTADYKIVCLSIPTKKTLIEKIGLLSPNIQKPNFEYYDISNLHRLFPEMPRRYGKFTIKRLLEVLETNEVPGYQKLVEEIVTTYVLDWFTHQLDRNPKNLLFERSKDGELSLTSLLDNEDCFAVNGNGKIDTNYNKIWLPSIPYEKEDFSQSPETFEDCDYNIFSALVDYPEIVIPLLKQLTDSNFDTIINGYSESIVYNQVYLSKEGIQFLKDFVQQKQEESNKMMKLIS